MTTELSVTELVRNFAEYLNRVFYRRERFVILRARKPVAELRPLAASHRLGELVKILESLPRLDPDDAGDFEADVDASRTQAGYAPRADPWRS